MKQSSLSGTNSHQVDLFCLAELSTTQYNGLNYDP